MKKNITDGNGFKIEHGIPLTPKGGPKAKKYPWREMKVGDSVFVPGKTMATIHYSVDWAKMKMGGGAKFAIRTVEGGIRVWRTA